MVSSQNMAHPSATLVQAARTAAVRTSSARGVVGRMKGQDKKCIKVVLNPIIICFTIFFLGCLVFIREGPAEITMGTAVGVVSYYDSSNRMLQQLQGSQEADHPAGSAEPEPHILVDTFPDLVQIVSNASMMTPNSHELAWLRGFSHDDKADVTFRMTNPTFHNGGLVSRYTNAHQCSDETPSTTLRASILMATDLQFRNSRFLDFDALGYTSALNELSGSCPYLGIEDPRTVGTSGALLGNIMRQVGQDCISTQVLLHPMDSTSTVTSEGTSESRSHIQVLPSPTGLSVPEKNWVHFEDKSGSPTFVYALFDAEWRTVFARCATHTSADAASTVANGAEQPIADGCEIAGHVQWEPKMDEDVQALLNIRSGTNWVTLAPHLRLSMAHESIVTESTYLGRRTRATHIEYASRFLLWDLRTRTMRVSERTIFATSPVDELRKGHVEFATSLQVHHGWWVRASFGMADCHAFVATFDAKRLLPRLPVEFELIGTEYEHLIPTSREQLIRGHPRARELTDIIYYNMSACHGTNSTCNGTNSTEPPSVSPLPPLSVSPSPPPSAPLLGLGCPTIKAAWRANQCCGALRNTALTLPLLRDGMPAEGQTCQTVKDLYLLEACCQVLPKERKKRMMRD